VPRIVITETIVEFTRSGNFRAAEVTSLPLCGTGTTEELMSFVVTEVQAAGFRSLQQIRFPVERLSVFVGANAAGKTNLYRVLQLLQSAAAGTLAREVAAEGGMQSALWAGERKSKEPARIALSVWLSPTGPEQADHCREVETEPGVTSYQIELGLSPPTGAAFAFEPQIKSETLRHRIAERSMTLLERRGPSGFARDRDGAKRDFINQLLATETALASLHDGAHFPDVDQVRRSMLEWRFYHDLRTDQTSPLRRPCLAVTTPTLSSDGADLAAVLATLAFIREEVTDLNQAIEDAFPGAKLVIPEPGRTASFGMRFPDYPKRVFEAGELSDGTLRYLALVGALLAYRLPTFVALNEPETSLHPDLLEPLARLIVRASERTQIWLVTHSERLAAALSFHGGVRPRAVIKRKGQTWIEGLKLTGTFESDDADLEGDRGEQA